MANPLRVGALIFILAFVLNGVWEVLQVSWYSGEHASVLETFVHCLPAIVIDSRFILALYALFLRSGERSIPHLTLPKLLLLSLVSVVTATAIEVLAISLGWWDYRASMPRVPVLGVGLLPVLQLGLLSPLTFVLLRALLKLGGREVGKPTLDSLPRYSP